MKQDIKAGARLTYQGLPVLVLAVDSDPACAVWITFTDDPDRDAMVLRSELS